MKQPKFNWSTKDKESEERNFKLEVKNMLQHFNIRKAERLSIIKNWLRTTRTTTVRNSSLNRTGSINKVC